MTENTNGGTELGVSAEGAPSTLPHQQILLNLDPYEEFRIHSYDQDGKETLVPNLGAEENFARIIQNKFDFTPTFFQRQLESIRFDDSQQLPPPTIRKIPEPEWEKTVNKLRQTIYEVQFIHDISKMMKESSEDQLIETVNAHRTFNEDLRTKEKAGELFPSRIEQLINTHGILKSGRDQLRKRSDRSGEFYQTIFQLQRKWKVKNFGNNNFFVDLAFNFPSIKMYESILVKIIRKKEHKSIDLIIPAIATYGRRSLLTSVVLKHYPDTLKNVDDILERAQQSIFYLELFEVLVTCMSRPLNTEFAVIELTDLEVKLQINQNVILVVTLVESASSPFWEIQTKLVNAASNALNLLTSESIDTLLQDCLLQIHSMVKDNTLTLEKAYVHFENVFKYLRHKLLCFRFESTIQESSELFSSLTISPSFFRYPDETIYHITTLSNSFNIHFKHRDILLNTKRFSSVKEMVYFMDLTQ